MPRKKTLSKPLPETTDLGRKVLAQEEILQVAIAYMARTDPRFGDHLRKKFLAPTMVAGNTGDQGDDDDYAKAFVRTVINLTKMPARKLPKQGLPAESSPHRKEAGSQGISSVRSVKHGRAKVDGKACDDHHTEKDPWRPLP